MIIVTRPRTSSSTYLYTTILKGKTWKKVTLMDQEDDKMIERLNKRGIEFIRLDGSAQVVPADASKDESRALVSEMLESLEYLDSVLSSKLSDQQVEELDTKMLEMVSKTIEKAKKAI